MEWKLGEIKQINGEWYQCIEGDSCGECSLFTTECGSGTKSNLADKVFGQCSKVRRFDKKHAIFKKLEKVGEPYEYAEHIFQEYHVFEKPIFTENYATIREFGVNSKISIEIKQNKEDMEEKGITLDDAIKYCSDAGKHSASIDCKMINYKIRDWLTELKQYKDKERFNSESAEKDLKPFNLEAAKAGRPVCTRDGRKARIICFDAKGDKPIIALIEMGVAETPNNYPIDGKANSTKETPCDLMMLPEKKEGWVNVYNDSIIYDTKEEALNRRSEFRGYIDTVKVSWEE